MNPKWDQSQAPSPRESMHSELLMHRNRHEIPGNYTQGAKSYQFGAWLKIKNSHDLPVMLIIEHVDFLGEHWQIVDTARVRNAKASILLSGSIEIKEKRIQDMRLYICHPNPDLHVEVEELRFNDQLIRKDFVDATNVA